MTAETVQLEVSRRIAAPPEKVYDAWLDPAALGQWLFATPGGVMEEVRVDPRVGGRFRIAERRGEVLAEHEGEYLELERPRRIVFTFDVGSGAPTRVTVTIAPDGDGSLVTLRHEGVWADYEDRTRMGWGLILEGLERTLAS